jgi:hypothetical protein
VLAWAAAMPAGMGISPLAAMCRLAASGVGKALGQTALAASGDGARCHRSSVNKAHVANSANSNRQPTRRTGNNSNKTGSPRVETPVS